MAKTTKIMEKPVKKVEPVMKDNLNKIEEVTVSTPIKLTPKEIVHKAILEVNEKGRVNPHTEMSCKYTVEVLGRILEKL